MAPSPCRPSLQRLPGWLLACFVVLAQLGACSSPASRPAARTMRRHHDDRRGGALVGALREDETRPTLRLPLVLNTSRSGLTRPELVALVAELNRIWAQAGICFEVRALERGFSAQSRLSLWLIAGDVPFSAGHYDGPGYIWSEDAPKLARAPHPAALPGARTAAHELGHALELQHVPRVGSYVDALMNTGYDGFALTPAEIRRARARAAAFALAPLVPGCRPPLW